MNKAQIYDYLYTESDKEKSMNSRLHNSPPPHSDFGDFFTLLSKIPVDCDSHNIPLVTWSHILNVIYDVYDIPTDVERTVVLFKPSVMEIPEHTHTYFEIIYVLSGSSVHVINQTVQTFTTGDFCILPPVARHAQSACTECNAIKILVRLSAFTEICAGLLKGQDILSRFLLGSIYNENSEQYLLFRTGDNAEVREHILDMFGEMLAPDNYTDRILTGMLMVLLLRLSKHWQAATQTVPLGNSDHEILLYVQENYSTITLEKLAAHLHYTVPYCSRYIKKLFGCTFSQLLKQIRFQKADLLLKNSTLTVNQISKMIGYENPENFMRAFKKRHKMTPSQYRNLYVENKEDTPLS